MSELRIGCIGAFVLSGLFSASVNHGLIACEGQNQVGSVAIVALVGFVAAVSLFGARRPS